MTLQKLAGCFVVLSALLAVSPPPRATAQSTNNLLGATSAAEGDGAHDFDVEFGIWKTHLKRLVHPLTGSTTWTEYDGTTASTPRIAGAEESAFRLLANSRTAEASFTTWSP